MGRRVIRSFPVTRLRMGKGVKGCLSGGSVRVCFPYIGLSCGKSSLRKIDSNEAMSKGRPLYSRPLVIGFSRLMRDAMVGLFLYASNVGT